MGRLDIKGVTKVFSEDSNEIVAVDDLNISINDGEFLVLVGPSGCGKSTTLRCIAGLERLTDGAIRLNETDISGRKPKDRYIAMVFQSYALYPHMTARENMSFGLKMSTDLSKSEINERVEEAAEMMGITELLEDEPGELSGGQQQRVALGRAIVREPEVFLMDEPLSNLDAKLRSKMRTELQTLQEELDTTTIYVTHDQTEAMTMGDRIAILNKGELQQIGTPLECYYSPNNKFVAGFIGSPSMNFLPVTYQDNTLQHEEFTYDLGDGFRQEALDSTSDLELGIRPEDIQLASKSDQNRIPVTVNVIEPMGDLTHIYFDIGGKQITATISGDTIINSDQIDITFPEDRIYLFDSKSGDAIKTSDIGDEVPQSALTT